MEKEYNGIVEDPRPEEEKAKDYKLADIAMGYVTLNWIPYDEKHLKTYIIQDQDGSSSCVAQAVSKLLAIHEVLEGRSYTQLCPKFIYTRRENYPSGGMWLPNALSIACNYGSCPEVEMPCSDKGETFMNDKSTEIPQCAVNALKYRGKYYFEIPVNIDEIANILEQGYGVLLGFRFDYDEWTDVPTVHEHSKRSCGHGVAAVDYCLYNGEKAIIIEDSWGPNKAKGGRRIITEKFLNARCFYAGYVTSLPNFKFTKTMQRGSTGIEVRKLQEVLEITVDGIFGPKTKVAVQMYQIKNKLVPDGIVGPKTRAVLNNE